VEGGLACRSLSSKSYPWLNSELRAMIDVSYRNSAVQHVYVDASSSLSKDIAAAKLRSIPRSCHDYLAETLHAQKWPSTKLLLHRTL
jgi:hypothetical protein